MRTTYTGSAAPYRYRRRRRRPLVVLTVIVVLLGVGAYFARKAYDKYQNMLIIPGCQAGSGDAAVPLDFGQAADAATIAGVAARQRLPARALTIAYATAYQESKLENLSYGDRDSVGIFQQRPSQGWGTVAQLQDPAFAAAAFFRELVKVPHYTTIGVSQAAQAVQHSADGSAYEQYADQGAALARDFTTAPHAVTCWYDPASQAASQGVSAKLNLAAARDGLADTFGRARAGGVVTGVSTARSGESASISVAGPAGWTVASWLVATASRYGITQVSYAGYSWTAGLRESSWQPDPSVAHAGIVAS